MSNPELEAHDDATITLEEQELSEHSGASDTHQLETIIVRASRRDRSLRELPQSISALDGRDLEAAGASAMRDYLFSVPGVGQTEYLSDLNRLTVRGIQTDMTTTTPQTTGVFIDDVPLNDPFLAHQRPDLYPYDLQRIEILKGPQGTLFGGSALAGALRYELQPADPEQSSVKLFAQYETVKDGSPSHAAGGAMNLALGDDRDSALRIVAVHRASGGLIDDLRNNEQDTDTSTTNSARLLWHHDFENNLTANLVGLYQETSTRDMPVAETTDGRLERERALLKSPSDSNYSLYSLNLAYPTQLGEIESTTSYISKYSDIKNATGARTLGIEDTGQVVRLPIKADIDGFTQEFRLLLSNSGWTGLIGFFGHYYRGLSLQDGYADIDHNPAGIDLPALITQTSNSSTSLANLVADITAREFAVFGELETKLTDELELLLGLRAYSIQTKGSVVAGGLLILAGGTTESRNDANIRKSGINPRLGLKYQLNHNIGFYGNVSRGFRFGGIQLVAPNVTSPDTPETYSPDSLWNYELGSRTQWLDDQLQLDTALFYLDWKNPQVRTTTGGAVSFNIIDNVGGARSYGAELSMRYLTPIPGLQLNLAASYVDAKTTAPFTTAGPGGDTTVPPGSRLPGHARDQLTAGLSYQRQIRGWSTRLQMTYVGQGSGVSDILQSMPILDYQTLNIGINLGRPIHSTRLQLRMNLNNVTDERAVVSAFVIDEGNFTTLYNRPRTFSLNLGLEL